ncbi:MAG TPA: hypothetical protein VII06_25445 [Chloroflexota bacterium]|jgi:hypothetical protein
MEPGASEPRGQATSAPIDQASAWAAQVEAAWNEGAAGLDGLAATWDVAPAAAAEHAEAEAARCWWDAPPWCGEIDDEEFRAIVAAYVARYGVYTPDLPEREPDVLREWLRAHGRSAQAPRVAA